MKDLIAILSKPRNVVTVLSIIVSLKLGLKYSQLDQTLLSSGFDIAGVYMIIILLLEVYSDGRNSNNSTP